jgi:Fic family protein
MEWFLGCLTRAIEGAQAALSGAIDKSRYWEKLREVPLNERQRLVINRLLEGFEGKLTTSKWAALTKSSNDTAPLSSDLEDSPPADSVRRTGPCGQRGSTEGTDAQDDP